MGTTPTSPSSMHSSMFLINSYLPHVVCICHEKKTDFIGSTSLTVLVWFTWWDSPAYFPRFMGLEAYSLSNPVDWTMLITSSHLFTGIKSYNWQWRQGIAGIPSDHWPSCTTGQRHQAGPRPSLPWCCIPVLTAPPLSWDWRRRAVVDLVFLPYSNLTR